MKRLWVILFVVPIFAQNALILKRELVVNSSVSKQKQETITIQPGEYIQVTYDTLSKSVTGVFSGFDNGEISIQSFDQYRKEVYTDIPVHLVSEIMVRPKKSGDYILGGAFSCGVIMYVLSMSDGYDSGVNLALAMIGAITGGLGGILFTLIKNPTTNKDVHYVLQGKDPWVIDNQDIK